MPPPSGGGGSKKGLLIGGIVAAFVLITVVGACAGLVVAAGGRDPEPVSPGGGGGGGGGRGESPSEGSVKDLIQQKVGPFTLQNVAEDPNWAQVGATEAYKAAYTSSNGDVLHLLSAFPSEERAAEGQAALPAEYEKQGFTEAGGGEVTGEGGEKVGSLTLMVNESKGTELVIWNNRQILAHALGETGNAQAFAKAVPY